MQSRHSALRWPLGALLLLVCVAPHPARAQSMLDGYWNLLLDEDAPEYGAGPEEGDYAGLPVTAAARDVAQSWDPEQLTVPEMQCQPFPSTYGPRAVTIMRVWEDRDPYNNQQTQIETWIAFAAQHRHIYMVPKPHPPPVAQASWQGYSTGRWVGNVLWVHTDQLKAAFIARNGLPLDDRSTMDERFFRYGDVLTDVMMISDPQYLTRPVIESKEYWRAPQGIMEPYPCVPNDETPRPQGVLPMHLPGVFIHDGPVAQGMPLKAAQGGAETMFPEYEDAMQSLAPVPALQRSHKRPGA